ncbi:glycine oxidase ThiO [Pullulanibacillus sp. KACC 23026]|uniref:glycine oxidase ThiO n=1 Tax=Pullulanibacillus sp. KACC 23026 TaxID=3028315 RepID=UPI0023AF8CE9|nr:glycine oxidase ThiO [Pullulanibacillus sp. KACC 23026]WEG13329.1 glycine oxidase ThiO [Pullulanibacillus sp. KACC 23026]
MIPEPFDSIIIGGGVNGCSIAYHLAKQGKKVLLLEKNKIGSEASSAAAGMLGVQAELDDPNSLFELAKKSRALFPAIASEIREVTHIDIELIWNGQLKIAETREQVIHYKKIADWQTSIGEKAVWLEPEEVLELEPSLSNNIHGALYFPEEGHVSAPQLTQGFAKAAAAFGAVIREFCEVQTLLIQDGTVNGVRTPTGDFYGQSIVVATGAWSRKWLPEGMNEKNAYFPVKGEAFSVQTNVPLLKRTVFTKGCYMVPKKGGELIIGATMEPHTFDKSVSVEGLSQLMNKVKTLLPLIGTATLDRFWSGIRPMTPDGYPYLGEHPELNHLFFAVGHSRNGILLSPITGKSMADLILGNTPSVDLTDFKLTRNKSQEVIL